jgi:hypothetical protein
MYGMRENGVLRQFRERELRVVMIHLLIMPAPRDRARALIGSQTNL